MVQLFEYPSEYTVEPGTHSGGVGGGVYRDLRFGGSWDLVTTNHWASNPTYTWRNLHESSKGV